MTSKVGAAALAAVVLSQFWGAADVLAQQAATKSTLQVIRERGKLLAGVRFDYPPVGTIDKTGKPRGFSIELAELFAEKLGVKLELVQTTSKSRIPLLIDSRIDFEVGSTSMSADREEVIDFSIPYIWDGLTVLTHKTSPRDVKGFAPPKVVATTQGSINAEMFREVVPNGDVKLYQEYTDAVVALLNKKIDGVIMSNIPALAFTQKHPELMRTPIFFRDAWGIGLRENDSDWRDFVNFTLQELWADGTYQKLWEKHFGEAPEWQMWSGYGIQPGIKAGQKRFGDRKAGKL